MCKWCNRLSPDDSHTPLAFKLNFEVTNNGAEYKACLAGIEAVLALGVRNLDIIGDSALVICQSTNKWKVKEPKIKLYQDRLQKLISQFEMVSFSHIPREQNRSADALATPASMIKIHVGVKVRPLLIEHKDSPNYYMVASVLDECDGLPWYTDIKNFICESKYPEGANEKDKRAIRRLAAQFILCEGDLYHRSYDGVQQRCVDQEQGRKIMEEIHGGVYRPHMNGHMLAKKISRQGCYWSTVQVNCTQLVKRCHQFQIHGDLMHMPPHEPYSTTTPQSFSTWGIDIVGEIKPHASNGDCYILVAIDYFTKWVEAASYSILRNWR